MTLRRGVAAGLAGAAFLAAGFLIGSGMGDNAELSEFGSAPATLTTDRSGVQVPRYAARKELPGLAVTTVEVATTESSETETQTETPTTTPASNVKKEEKTPIKTTPLPTPSPEPDITVGKEEKTE